MPHSTLYRTLCVGFLMASASVMPRSAAADNSGDTEVPNNPATAHELPQIIVIGNAPLSGLGLP